MGEHQAGSLGVKGSSPFISTIKANHTETSVVGFLHTQFNHLLTTKYTMSITMTGAFSSHAD